VERSPTTDLRVAKTQRLVLCADSLHALIDSLDRGNSYGWFTEGFDTADLKDAKALLDELNE
jgi:hypothetical protein